MENLFSVIRGKGGHCDSPDASQFRSAFRQAMVDVIMVSSSGANCQKDVDILLLTSKNFGVSAGQGEPPFPTDPLEASVPTFVQPLLAVTTLPTGELSTEESNILF